MYYLASIYAYDVMDTIQVTALVRAATAGEESPTTAVLHATTLIDGTGEADPRQWLEDALVGLLEAL